MGLNFYEIKVNLMKIKILVLCVLFTFFNMAYAKDFVAYQKLNSLFVVDDQSLIVFKEDISNVQTVDLREDLAIIKMFSGELKIFNEKNEQVFKNIIATNYKISKNLLVASLGIDQLSVYDQSGKILFSDNRVTSFSVSDTMIAYKKQPSNQLIVKNQNGEEIVTQFNVKHAILTNEFIMAVDTGDFLRVYDKNGKSLLTHSNVLSIKASDNHFSFTDNWNYTSIYSRKDNSVTINWFDLNVNFLLNSIFSTTQNNTMRVFNHMGEELFWDMQNSVAFYNEKMFAILDNSRTFRLYNNLGTLISNRYNVLGAKISKNLYYTKQGPNHFEVRNNMNDLIYSIFTPDLFDIGLSNSIISFRERTANSFTAINEQKQIIVKEINVNNFWMTNLDSTINWRTF